MSLHFLGKDPSSPDGGSPTVLYDETDDSYIIQGYKIADSGVLTQLNIPDHETVIRLPRRMMQFFPEVNGAKLQRDVG
jgi:hypothetical protein